MVPLFILWLGYEEREAAGTSLAAIVIIAGAAVIVQLIYGNVHVGDGLLVGVPAVGGVVAGTWLQQRVPRRKLQILFAAAAAGERREAGDRMSLGAIAHRVRRGRDRRACSASAAAWSSSPALVILLGLDQVDAEATSLLAIVPGRARRRLPPERLRQPAPARGAARRRAGGAVRGAWRGDRQRRSRARDRVGLRGAARLRRDRAAAVGRAPRVTNLTTRSRVSVAWRG